MKLANLAAAVGLLLLAHPGRAQAPEPPRPPANAIGFDGPAPTPTAEVPLPEARQPGIIPLNEQPWPQPAIPAYPTVFPPVRTETGHVVIPVQGIVAPAQPGYLPPATEAPMPPRRAGLLPKLLNSVTGENEQPVMLQDQPGRLPAVSEVPVPTEPLQLPATQPAAIEPMSEVVAPKWPRFWTQTEFLLWLLPRAQTPIPLLTTGPAQFDPPPGVLDDPNTDILIGEDQLKFGNYPGARLTFGLWFTQNEVVGLEANAFWLGSNGISKLVPPSAAESGVLSRPFLNALNNTTAVAVIAFPGVLDGLFHLNADSRLFGGELNLIGKFMRREHWDLDVIGGYRYLELRENLEVSSETLTLDDNVAAFLNNLLPTGTNIQISDRFVTKNRFQGGQFGIRTNHHLGAMTLSVLTKVAVGNTRQFIDIAGNTTRVLPGGASASYPGGVFAVGTNSGTFARDAISVVPQFQLNIAYQCKDWLKVFATYEFLFWSDVVRPGDQVDPFLNPEQIPTFLGFDPTSAPLRPQLPFQTRTFWAQGISIGAEFRY